MGIVTDPDLIRELNEGMGGRESSKGIVTDPDLIKELDAQLSRPTSAKKLYRTRPEDPWDRWARVVADDLVEKWPQTTGATAGAIVGSSTGPGGMIIGAGIGGIIGEAYKQVYEHIRKPGKAPKTSKEAADKMALAGTEEIVTETLGFGIGRVGTIVANRVLSPFAKHITPEGKMAMETLEKYIPKSKITKQKHPGLLPYQLTEHRGLDILGNIAEGSILGGKKITDFKNINLKQTVNDMIDDIASMFSSKADPDAIAEVIVATATKNYDVKVAYTTPIYNAVKNMVRPVTKKVPVKELVDTGLLDAQGKPLMTSVTKMVEKKVGGAQISLKENKDFARSKLDIVKSLKGMEAKNAGDDLIYNMMEQKGVIDYETAQVMRSRLISRINEFDVTNKTAPGRGIAKKMVELIDKAIDEGLKEFSPKALGMWRWANKEYKEANFRYNNKFIRKLLKKADPNFGAEPEAILKMIVKKGGISALARVKAATDKKTMRLLKGWHFSELMKQSLNEETKELMGSKLFGNMTGKAGLGEQALKILYSPEEIKSIKNLATTLSVIQAKQREGVGKMWIQLVQASAAAELFGIFGGSSATIKSGSALIVFGPSVISRLFTNPVTAKWFIQGYGKLPKYPSSATAFLMRLANLSGRIEKQIESDKQDNEED